LLAADLVALSTSDPRWGAVGGLPQERWKAVTRTNASLGHGETWSTLASSRSLGRGRVQPAGISL